MFLFVCSVNDFSTTRGPIQAKFCMRAYSGSECVFSLLEISGPRRTEKGGNEISGNQWRIFAFWRFLSDISATRGRIHT